MANKKEKSNKSIANERVENLSLKRKPTIDLTEKMLASLPPIRISIDVKRFLEKHFREKGTQLSNGVRMIIYDYVKKNI